MRPLLLLAALALAGCVSSQPRYTPAEGTPPGNEPVAQLRLMPLPEVVLDTISVHAYFVVYVPEVGRWERYELWRRGAFYETLEPQQPKRADVGHIREGFLAANSPLGGGPIIVAEEWRGEDVRRLRAVLERPWSYPRRHRYWGWPGPNSNSYAAWVLREAELSATLDPRAIGKDDLGWVGAALTPTRTGLQLDTPILGLAMGLLDGAQLHALGLTFGVDLFRPALLTPLGRIGWPTDLGEFPAPPE